MANERTKTIALKDLGEAVTGKTLSCTDADTVVSMLDKITAEYSDVTPSGDYSTTEQRIGTWVDGKPLYRKVGTIVFTEITTGTYTTGSLIDSNLDYCTIDKVFVIDAGATGNLYNGKNSNIANLVYVESAKNSEFYGRVIGFTNRNDLLNKTIYVVCEYTKTTD